MGGVPIGYTKSEFYTVTSLNSADYQPIDLTGAIEVVIANGSITNGHLTNQPVAGSNRIPLRVTDPPLVVHSTDGYLFFVSDEAAVSSTISIWVVRG